MKAARTLRTERAVLAPYSVWALLFVLVPLIFVAYYAFTDNSFAFTTEHITRFFTAPAAWCRTTAAPRRSTLTF